MAIIKTGGGVAAISGSLDGQVFSHNRGGPYMRNRAIPTNPGTTPQQVVRQLLAQLSNVWATTLTAAQRAAWDAYAEAVPLPNALGEPRNVGGIGMFIRSNLPRGQSGYDDLPRVDSGPTVYTLGDFTAPTFSDMEVTDSTFDVSFEGADDWTSEDDAAMLVYVSRGVNPARNYFKGPYRYAGAILGNSVLAPTNPTTLTSPFAYANGQSVFYRVRVTRADGRLASSFRGNGVAATA